MQTGTFIFAIFQATMFNSLPTSFYNILEDEPDKDMYAIPPQGHFQTCDNLSTHFFNPVLAGTIHR